MSLFSRRSAFAGLLLLLVGCGASYPDLVTRRSEVKSLKSQKRKVSNQIKMLDDLKRLDKETYRLILPPKAVKGLLAKFHPHAARGKQLSKKHLKGYFRLSNPEKIKFVAPDRLRYRVTFSGRDVKVSLKGVPFASASKERELSDALTAGASVTVETRLRLDRKRGALWLDSDCVSLTLKRSNTKQNRSYLKDALNKKIFNIPKVVPLPNTFKSKKSYLLVSKGGIVLGFPK